MRSLVALVSHKRSRLCLVTVGLLCFGLVVASIGPAQAVPMITLGNGVTNPPPSVTSTALVPPQTAIGDTAVLVPVATFGPILQQVLNAQRFTGANNWTLNTTAVTLNNNATFNITQYNLALNPGGNNQGGGLPNGTPAGSAFSETMAFTLNPNLAGPNVPAGSTATLHWLQILNEDRQYGGFGFPIAGQQGFWQVDNGDINGGAVSATVNGSGTNNGNNGPYYDSNNNSAVTGRTFSVPPPFFDSPRYYAGVGTYLHFTAIPTWDVFTPAAGGNLATDVIDVADFGLAWGFAIVPQPSSSSLVVVGFLLLIGHVWRRRRQS